MKEQRYEREQGGERAAGRSKEIIQTSKQTDESYISAMKGKRSDTRELNINVKTLTLTYLRELEHANQLGKAECEIIQNYSGQSACFQSIVYLFFGSEQVLRGSTKKGASESSINPVKQKSEEYREARRNLRHYCTNYYRSTFFIKNFLRSSRMHLKNKLIIIKFLRKIEYLAIRKFKEKEFQWKNLDFQM